MSLVVHKILPQGRGLARPLLARAASVALDRATRQRDRFDAVDSHGRALEVSLPSGSVLRHADVLVAEDGSLVTVVAAPEPVQVVRAAAGGSALDLLRAAYQLGRRQVVLELHADRLHLAPDPALGDMLRGMPLAVTDEVAPFEPEPHAFAALPGAPAAAHGGHVHGPHCNHGAHDDHGRGHDHGHDHAHDHGHSHGHG